MTKLGEIMNCIIIHSNDKNIANAYIYDPAKHVGKGEKSTQVFRFGDFEYSSTTFRNKNKLSRSNGCLTTIDPSSIDFKDPTYRFIKLPQHTTPSSKYVLAFRAEDGKYFGLKIAFKKIQSYDSQNSKVIYNGKLNMQITCQDDSWVKLHSSNELEHSICHNGYYMREYISNKKINLLNYLSNSNAPIV